MSASDWTRQNIPDLSGKTLIITGANSGIGLEAARLLASRGAQILLACRDLGKASTAVDSIKQQQPDAKLEALELDLASLASIRSFAETILSRGVPIDVLVNNAGVMALPYRKTRDGFEMQIGTNHLGHFALTGLLLDRILETPSSRIVNVSSTAHKIGKINFEDLHSEQRYQKWLAYGQSKLANLLFTHELQRKLEAKRVNTIAVSCHPGYASTNLQTAGPRMEGSSFAEKMSELGNRLLAQTAETGSLPTVQAAAGEGVRGGDYFGPDGFMEMRGNPKKVQPAARALDRADASRLWESSQELTKIGFETLAAEAS